MRKVIVDAEFLAMIIRFREAVEFCDSRGRTIGRYHPAEEIVAGQEPRIKSLVDDEEIERRRRDRTGRPLGDIWRDLGAE